MTLRLSTNAKRNCTLSLLALSAITLIACASSEASKWCPVKILPDDCTEQWLLSVNPPQCFADWFDGIANQQQAIADNCP